MERIEVFYCGHVQGVGFRYNACEQADGLAVTGWVQNLPDRRVQMVAEGSIGDLKELLRRIDQSMSGNIRDKSVAWQSATGQLAPFQIKR